jgi:hypothetical protein
MIIVHGGQTGVDRGAHDGATDNHWSVAGFMPQNGQDELGPIPFEVYTQLKRCLIPGNAARTELNIEKAHAVLVVVPDKDDPYATPGTRLTLMEARRKGVPRLVVQPDDPIEPLVSFVEHQEQRAGNELRLMVAGPRASRWSSGQIETAGVLRRLKRALDYKADRR